MALTADDIKQMIQDEVGDITRLGRVPTVPTDGLIYQRIDDLWIKHAAKDQIAPGLRELYTKRDCLRIILGVLAPRRFDTSDVLAGLTIKAGQIWTHYQELLECCKTEIASVESKHGGSGAYLGGRLLTRAPYTPRYPPDANNPRYGGTPYIARRRRGIS